MRRVTATGFLLALLWSAAASAADFVVAGWNVESDRDTDPAIVARRLAAYPDVDMWGLSEVQNQAVAERFRAALAGATDKDFALVLGRTGGDAGTSPSLRI